MPTVSPSVLPVLMLFASNVFMTFAWYGHLKFKESWLPLVVLVSWGIAFFEYWLAVPANRWGSAVYSAAQLKTMQEVITLVVISWLALLQNGLLRCARKDGRKWGAAVTSQPATPAGFARRNCR